MSVKIERKGKKDMSVEDDLNLDNESNEDSEESVDEDKLNALKAKLNKKESGMPPKIVEKKRKSLEIGVVGSGQAGSRLASAYYQLGYPAICFNTATQDLEHIKIPEDNKYLLEYGIGGAAKEMDIGREAAEAHMDGINAMVHTKLADAQLYLLCLSLGGGSGAGSCETMVNVLRATGKPVVVMTVLPMSTDDAQTKNNALTTLSKLTSLVKNKELANLIVVDNAKIETIYSDVGQMNFFNVSNQAIVEPIDVFNKFSSMPSDVKSLDPMEFAKLFTDGEGLTIYGSVIVPNYEEDVAIAEAVVNNLESGLLAGGFDLKQTKYAGVLIIANQKVWDKIPNSSVNYAMSIIKDVCGGSVAGIFKGVYVDDSSDDVVRVYSMFSGLGLPDSRVTQLKTEVTMELEKTKEKSEARNINLSLDTGVDKAVSDADKVKQKIKSRSSTFVKNFGLGRKDFRKK